MADSPDRSAEHSLGRPLLAVFSATFFVRFAFGITVAVLASYISGTSGGLPKETVGVVGVVAALSPVGEFSTVLLAGAAADRYGRFPVLFSGIGAAAVIFVLISLTHDPASLALANLGYGVASGAILASSLAIVADFSGASERGLEMGRFDAMNLSGWIAGFAFGLALKGLLPLASLPLVFQLGAAILAGGLGFAALLVRGQPTPRRSSSYSFQGVLRQAFRRSVLLVTLPWVAIYMLIGAALFFLGSAASGLGIPLTELAAVIAVAGLILVVTQPFFGRLSDRFGRMRLMIAGAAGFVLVLVFASLIAAFGPKLPLLAGLGVSVLAALMYGPAALASLADLAHEMSRATTMAIYSLSISVGMLVGLLAVSLLYAQFGTPGLYVFFGTLAAAISALTAARYLELRRSGPLPATIPAR